MKPRFPGTYDPPRAIRLGLVLEPLTWPDGPETQAALESPGLIVEPNPSKLLAGVVHKKASTA
jgi:hypothetical protein